MGFFAFSTHKQGASYIKSYFCPVLQQFLNHIEKNKLFNAGDNVLLAVSGGIDSMVMLRLFIEAGFNIGVAHCNFQLRLGEADREEELVRRVCSENDIPCFVTRFETIKYAEEHGLSTQVAARELRYTFFKKVSRDEGFTHIATAHQLNDTIETVLINLVRGTGIDGLTGIPGVNGNIIRPLLFATRADIKRYADENGIEWREDSSNSENVYARNLIRNEVVPILRKINPNLEASFLNTLQRIQGVRQFSTEVISSIKGNAFRQEDNEIYIDLKYLYDEEYATVLLWEWIKEFGFNYEQCDEILRDHQSGKKFFSKTHQILVDRNSLILTRAGEVIFDTVTIVDGSGTMETPLGTLTFEHQPITVFNKLGPSHIAQMDLAKLKFPLLWRKWKPGDWFVPLGMSQRKKLSDFLIDLKVPVTEKDKVTVVESAGEIIWVVGYRISESVKITEAAAEIFVMEFHP